MNELPTELLDYIELSRSVPGWTRDAEALGLAEVAYNLRRNPVIVEIGCFLGSGSIILAGARKLRGSGKVHCVDPFDCSGDSFSVPHYEKAVSSFDVRDPKEIFDHNIRSAGLSDWIQVHVGKAESAILSWSNPIDLLFLDGDQSWPGAYAAFNAWEPWLKPSGTIAIHNSEPRQYMDGHDGQYRLACSEIVPPKYNNKLLVGSTTFARRSLI